jgi:mono/diheme cytochrome c family protein
MMGVASSIVVQPRQLPAEVLYFETVGERETTVKLAEKRFNGFLQLVPAIATVSVAILAASQQTQSAPSAEGQPSLLIHSIEGPDLFRAYCAACHGVDAKGTGPAAHALKARMPDLTSLARKNHGQFPAARVRETIMGEQVVAAHGSREMPIWGPVFHQVEGDVDWGNVRLENLVKYLESIQPIRNPNAPPGT